MQRANNRKLNNIMRKERHMKITKALATIIFGSSILAFNLSSPALASVNPSNLVQNGYWYTDDDIREVIKDKLDESKYYVAPAIPFDSRELVTDIVRDSVNEARLKGSALIPVNFGNHWAALAIKRTDNGGLKVIYNDSLGSPITDKTNSQLLKDVLTEIDPSIEIIDLQVRQQTDGSSCGAFTAENLMTIAELNVSNLTENDLKEIISKINDAESIRQSHFYLLVKGDGDNPFTVDVVEEELDIVVNSLTSYQDQITSIIGNISTITNDRLVSLNGLSGISSGSKAPEYGAWIKGIIGSNSGKTKINSNNIQDANLDYNSSAKGKLYGAAIGVDKKIDEDGVVGISYTNIMHKGNHEINTISDSSNNKDSTSVSKLLSHIVTAYGSTNISNELVLHGLISYGHTVIKNSTDAESKFTSKQNGHFLSSNISANYLLYSGEYLSLVPRIKGTYSDITLKGYSTDFIKIPKNNNQELQIAAGASLFMDISGESNIAILPELSFEYSRSLMRKGSTLKISNFINQQTVTADVNNNHDQLNLGVNLNILSGDFELGLGYEHVIQNKKKSKGANKWNIGYLKLRIEF